MRYIVQSRVGDTGTCFRACIASILDLKERNVPDWPKANLDPGVDAWLAPRGLQYVEVPATQSPPAGYHIITGTSPRGGQHAVVGYGGEFVWDPHPRDGTGRYLVDVANWGMLVSVGAAEDTVTMVPDKDGEMQLRYSAKDSVTAQQAGVKLRDATAALEAAKAEAAKVIATVTKEQKDFERIVYATRMVEAARRREDRASADLVRAIAESRGRTDRARMHRALDVVVDRVCANDEERKIARWESKTGKYWVDLYFNPTFKLANGQTVIDAHFRSNNAGGGVQARTEAEAIAAVQAQVNRGYFQPDANKTPLSRVKDSSICQYCGMPVTPGKTCGRTACIERRAKAKDSIGDRRFFSTNGKKSAQALRQAKADAFAYAAECKKAGVDVKVTVQWLPPYGTEQLPIYTVERRTAAKDSTVFVGMLGVNPDNAKALQARLLRKGYHYSHPMHPAHPEDAMVRHVFVKRGDDPEEADLKTLNERKNGYHNITDLR